MYVYMYSYCVWDQSLCTLLHANVLVQFEFHNKLHVYQKSFKILIGTPKVKSSYRILYSCLSGMLIVYMGVCILIDLYLEDLYSCNRSSPILRKVQVVPSFNGLFIGVKYIYIQKCILKCLMWQLHENSIVTVIETSQEGQVV